MISDEEIKTIMGEHKDVFDALKEYDETGKLPNLKKKANKKSLK